MLFLNIQIFHLILNFRIDDLCCVTLVAGKVFWVINFGKFWDSIIWKVFLFNIYWNCNYIVSFSGVDIGGCLLDWRL